ncbi:hypothetical protein EJ110_NYTH34759 [Nymphaea thermarum]|nr:hypothetical protein EJ110_NYTH34759 [Nymphaea thermarum]
MATIHTIATTTCISCIVEAASASPTLGDKGYNMGVTIKQATWNKPTESWNVFWTRPIDQCDVYAVCGAFGACNNQLKENTHLCECLDGFEPASAQEWESNAWSGGCRRKNRLQCEGDHFTKTSIKRSSDPSSSNATGGTGESCGLACMTDCSCTAYSYRDGTFHTWEGDVLNLVKGSTDSTGDSILVLVASSRKSGNVTCFLRMMVQIQI